MSWYIALVDADDEPATVDTHTHGTTYPLGGTDRAELAVTTNYRWPWRAAAALRLIDDDAEHMYGPIITELRRHARDPARALHNRTAEHTIRPLAEVLRGLGATSIRNHPGQPDSPIGSTLDIVVRAQAGRIETDRIETGALILPLPHPDSSAWTPDRGNVARTIATLLTWATTHPDATWTVD